MTSDALPSARHCQYLSEPLQLGDLTLRNRNIMASCVRNRSVPINVPNDLNLEYYVQRAKGGAGLIMTEGTLVSPQGTEWPYNPGIWSEEQVEGWKKIVDAVHANGVHMFCQVRWFVNVCVRRCLMERVHSYGIRDASLILTWRSRRRLAKCATSFTAKPPHLHAYKV